MKGTLEKTTMMSETANASPPRRRGAYTAKRALRWLWRVTSSIFITLFGSAVVMLFVGTFMLSNAVERSVARIDWGLVESTGSRYVMTEDQLEVSAREFVEPYALDAVDNVEADFFQSNKVQVSMELFSQPVSLQARLEIRDGVPAIILERLNDIPLYVVGGIISGGINNGFRKGWQDSPLQVTSIAVKYDALTIDLEPK